VDQRGTGGSHRVVPFQSAFERRIKSWFANPQINQQMDPRFYTTSLAMDDLDDVRQALGYDKINVAGGSYGTTAAQYYLRQHEAHVRSLILVNGSLLDIPVFERWSLSGQLALDRVFDLCLADAACKAAFPNIRQEFKDLWARMAEEPVTIGFSDKSLGTATLTPRYMGAVLRLMLKDAKNDGRVPLLIHRAYAENDWQGFAQFIESNSNIEWWGPQIMEHVIRCGEKWARFDPAEVARLGKGTYALDYDLWLAQQQVDVCALTPRGVMPEGDSPQPRSNVPVLIFSSALDSIDPPENVAGADKVFPNSLSVVMPYQSHNISDYNTGYCLFSLEQQFIQSGSVQGLDASCLANIRPPVFETR
jgi:pimeloyl-ACP methyl ester carboxylesterase